MAQIAGVSRLQVLSEIGFKSNLRQYFVLKNVLAKPEYAVGDVSILNRDIVRNEIEYCGTRRIDAAASLKKYLESVKYLTFKLVPKVDCDKAEDPGSDILTVRLQSH
jgi:hypothetical protein